MLIFLSLHSYQPSVTSKLDHFKLSDKPAGGTINKGIMLVQFHQYAHFTPGPHYSCPVRIQVLSSRVTDYKCFGAIIGTRGLGCWAKLMVWACACV